MNDGKRAFELLRKISFERIGGSKEEYKALKIIEDALKVETDTTIEIEEFNVDSSNIKNVKFQVTEPNLKDYNVTAYKMCGDCDIEGEIVYLENPKLINRYELENKIVLLDKRFSYKLYEELVNKKVKGLVVASGTVYDKMTETDLEERFLRERHYSIACIPAVSIRINDLQTLVRSNAKKAHIIINQEQEKAVSHNLVATITGSKYPQEVIAFTAHYDSVRFSPGAYDNGTGAVTIFELYHYFLMHKPARTLKFIWCGSEEMGLLGSHAYCQKHNEDLKDYRLCINIDMTGVTLGHDIAVCTSGNELVNYLDYFGKRKGEIIECSQDVYSSDSTPFAFHGIPAISFARISPDGGADIHSRKDLIDFIDEYNLGKMVSFIASFAEELIEADSFPVERTMPDNMKTKLNEYLGKKAND